MTTSCPAATLENPVQGEIARCGIHGHVQMADGSPCCGEYTSCPIWRAEKERLWENKHAQRAPMNVRTDGTMEWVA